MRLTRVRALGVVATMLLARGAAADPLPTSAEHVVSGGRSIVTDDTTEATVLNPANLAWLPAPEMRFDWVGCSSDLAKVGCGESLATVGNAAVLRTVDGAAVRHRGATVRQATDRWAPGSRTPGTTTRGCRGGWPPASGRAPPSA